MDDREDVPRNSWREPRSAIVVIVPEAEQLTAPFRDRYDPAFAAGMPAHITLHYPFYPPDELTEAQIDAVRRCLAVFPSVAYRLTELRHFPRLLYLACDPDEPFRQMTLALWRRFPDRPPYGGAHPDIVPHLSVAQSENDAQAAVTAAEFARSVQGRLPLGANATEAALMDDASGRWELRARFPFAGD